MKEKINKYLPYSLIIFGILTFVLMWNRVPCADEAHSWLISKSFTFFELFKIEKYDGHLFIWHTLQMPFSKNDLFYPYSIFILNWLFCMGALIVMWRFAPFSNILKTLITFSYPFVWYFSQVARCYSLSVLFIFIILALFKDRLKRPIVFSALLIILANTSAMALIGAFVLGLIFIYDLIKNYKTIKTRDLIIVFSILALGVLIVGVQLLGAGLPRSYFRTGLNFSRLFRLFVFSNPSKTFFTQSSYRVFRLITCLLFLISIPYFYLKSKRAFIIFYGTFFILCSFFTYIYWGFMWHYLFFYIYFIAALWVSKTECIKETYPNLTLAFKTVLFIFLSLYFVQTCNFKNTQMRFLHKSKAKKMVNAIKENKLFEGAEKIYTLEYFQDVSLGIIPYLPQYTFIDTYGHKKYNMESIKDCNNRSFDETNIDMIAETIDNTKKNILVTRIYQKETIEGVKWNLKLEEVFSDPLIGLCVYSIKRVQRK